MVVGVGEYRDRESLSVSAVGCRWKTIISAQTTFDEIVVGVVGGLGAAAVHTIVRNFQELWVGLDPLTPIKLGFSLISMKFQ